MGFCLFSPIIFPLTIALHRDTPSLEYRAQFPILPASLQPPNKPLLNPHPVSTLYELGLYFPPADHNGVASRSFSLLPPEESGYYALSGDHYVFANDAEPTANPTWYTMETRVPFAQARPPKENEWAGAPRIRASGQSPLFSVRHELHVALTCTYDLPESEKATERLHFSFPLSFVHMTPTPPLPSPSPQLPSLTHSASSSVSSSTASLVSDMLPPSAPYAQCLPAYSQLFDSNGDRKIDYSIPLPLYTPPSPASSSSGLGLDPLPHAGHERKEVALNPNDVLPEGSTQF